MQAETKLEFVKEKYDWKTLSLWGFLEEGNIPSGWEEFFMRDDIQRILKIISDKLQKEAKEGKTIYPNINKVFRALMPLDKVKVVIIGQDPYPNGSAVGYCFSVLPGNYINPSLKNIYKELKEEGYTPNENGILLDWVKQGCMLLNTALTVIKNSPDTHTMLWYDFTVELIKYINENTKNVVWILMGSKALAFSPLMSNGKYLVSSHPSPFSAHKGFRNHPAFLGSNLFKDANKILKNNGKSEIKW